ncbi:MAG: hypothetical protein JWM21_3033 [Acidobacteria bacterium]|nr:hypothetical protein [Acidobacteriota bacterium]
MSVPRTCQRIRINSAAELETATTPPDDKREFKLEVEQNIICRFALEGPDVYSLTVLSLLRSSAGAQTNSPASLGC